MPTTIKVPEAGVIIVCQLSEFSTVTFRGIDGVTADFRVIPRSNPDAPESVYHTVREAIALYEASDPELSLDWEAYTAVPIGRVRVTRHWYRVVDDGHGGSGTTAGKYNKETVPILRGYSESLGECVMRTIQETGTGEDFGTLDSFSGGETWGTIPFADLSGDSDKDQRYGQPYITHWITFLDGEILHQLPQLAEEFRQAGASW